MHLNKLIMRNFKKFRRAEVEFQDGLTGIAGRDMRQPTLAPT
jgi:exonuclease SbcC